jgi:predicted DNA-binding transcriptional regulator YafY
MGDITPFLRRVQILRWLHNSNGMPSTVKEIIQHLRRERFLEDQSSVAQLKTVQRDLVELSDQKTKDNQLGLCWQKGEANELKWWIEEPGHLDFEVTKIAPDDLLTTLQLAKKHLINVMPPYAYSALGRYFDSAERQINERLINKRRNLNRLIDRIHVDQRGQRLLEPRSIREEILNSIFDALEQNKQLKITYRGKQHKLHPAGLILKPPKTYLLALHDKYMDQSFRPYLVHRIEKAQRTGLDAEIPSSFDLKDYVLKGNSDTPLFFDENKTENIVLRVYLKNSGNLLADLKETPPFINQSIRNIAEDSCQLHFESKLTTQLEEWILGRSTFVEVLKPLPLRNHLKKITSVMANQYN